MNWEETQEALRAAIKAERGTQAEIARKVGVSRATVTEYVNGERNFPAGHISAILDTLNLEIVIQPKASSQGSKT